MSFIQPMRTSEADNRESRGIPHTVIIGRDGHILRVYTGYSEERLAEIVADINEAPRPLPGMIERSGARAGADGFT